MNKQLIVALLLLSFAWQACYMPNCKEKDYFHCEFPLSGRRYFEAYKEGTFWVYYNRDYSKMDSVYVYNSVVDTRKVREKGGLPECWTSDTHQYKLASRYLRALAAPIQVEIDHNSCKEARFHWFGGTMGFCLVVQDNSLSSCDHRSVEPLASFALRDEPLLLFPDVLLVQNRYWFAPNFGLIQYVSHDGQDTFFIERFNGR